MPLAVSIETGRADWDAFVAAHPEATAYHAWDWRDVFGPVFGHEPIYLAARDGGRVVGVLPLVSFRSRLFGQFFCSLPFVNYGGVLATTPDAAAPLLAEAARLARERGAAHVELRHVERQVPDAPVRQHKVTMLLPLQETAEAQWTALDNKVRNMIRKAEKSDLTSESGGIELLDAFYAVFSVNMRDLGTPVYPKRFFAAVLKACGPAARLHVVRHQGSAGGRIDDDRPPEPCRSAVGVGAARGAGHEPEHAALLAHAARGHRRAADACSTSADRRRARARSCSRSSGRPNPCRCTGSTRSSRAMPRPIRAPAAASSRWPSSCGRSCPCRSPTRIGPLIIGNIP